MSAPRLLTPNTGSGTLQGSPRLFLTDDGELLVQLYEAPAEALQTYDVSFEAEQVAAFRRGEPLPDTPAVVESRRTIADLTGAGRRLWRVHVVDVPLSEYLRYEFAAYEANIAAGEEVYIADRAAARDLAQLRDDFVLFDDAAVVWFRYDGGGRLLGYDYDDSPAALERCRAARDLAVRWAVPFHEFTAAAGVR
jgi:hypothetical protein